jgi:hypothetical protein
MTVAHCHQSGPSEVDQLLCSLSAYWLLASVENYNEGIAAVSVCPSNLLVSGFGDDDGGRNSRIDELGAPRRRRNIRRTPHEHDDPSYDRNGRIAVVIIITATTIIVVVAAPSRRRIGDWRRSASNGT